MSIKLTRRIASEILNRGESSLRIKEGAVEEVKKAITRADVRELVKNGSIYALPAKHNLSVYSKVLREKRNQGRKRGHGRRKGTAKARMHVDYKKRIRAQRRVLAALKDDRTLDNITFKALYRLVKGGNFASKITLISHIKSRGISLTDERVNQLRHM